MLDCRIGPERIEQARCASDQLLHIGILAVEHAQRIRAKATLRVLVEILVPCDSR